MKHINVKIADTSYSALYKRANASGLSFSDLVRDLLERGLGASSPEDARYLEGYAAGLAAARRVLDGLEPSARPRNRRPRWKDEPHKSR